ncbi:MAG: methyltransferase domain-containing protein [Pseudomonadota bacterium]
MPFDKIKARTFTSKVVDDLAGTMITRLCAIGDALGLFKALHEQGPATSEQLAERTDIHERYAREWLRGMHAAGYLEVDRATSEYRLPAEHAALLADDANPLYQGGMWELMVHSLGPFDTLVDAFRNGGGVSQACFHPNLYNGMRRSSGLRYQNSLLQEWLPAMPDVVNKLSAGATVADIGCGSGTAILTMVEAFPNSQFTGYDAFAPQVERANAQARERGLDDRVHFDVVDASLQLPNRFDIITTFDVIHDMAHPREALRTIHEHLNEGGLYVMQEIAAADDPHDNVGSQAALKYGMSITYCMTTSLANEGEGLGTLGLPPTVVRSLCDEAGFSSVESIPCRNEFFSLFLVRP